MHYPDPRAALAAMLVLMALGCEREEYCTNTCRFASDQQCDEGTSATGTGYCARGTDCTDCGPNENVEPGFQLDAPPSDPPPFEYHDAPGEAPPGLTLSETCGEGPREACGTAGAGLGYAVWYTSDGCGWGWYNCPGNFLPVFPDTGWIYECREDGPNGIGCYYEDAPSGATHWEHCRRLGSCTCPDGTRYEDELEQCWRMPVFYGRDHVASCTTSYRVGDQRHECGTYQCSPHGAPVACNLEIEVAERLCGCGELPPPPPVSPGCAAAIDMVRASYDDVRRAGVCQDRCVDDFFDCAERTDCRELSGACSRGYSDCLMRC